MRVTHPGLGCESSSRNITNRPVAADTPNTWIIDGVNSGTLNGVLGEVDRNAFYGDENDWTVFLLTGCDPRMVEALGPNGRCRLAK
jgi:hypothetical protein